MNFLYVRNRIWSAWFRFKNDFYLVVSPHLPKIVRTFPKPPVEKCPECGQPLNIKAYNTGDGWEFHWDCDDYHDSGEHYQIDYHWFPFLFGWATGSDLWAIGIDVV